MKLAKPLPPGIEWCPVCQGSMPVGHAHHPRPTLYERAQRERRAAAHLYEENLREARAVAEANAKVSPGSAEPCACGLPATAAMRAPGGSHFGHTAPCTCEAKRG